MGTVIPPGVGTHLTGAPSSWGAPGPWAGAQEPPRPQAPPSRPGRRAGAWARAPVSGRPVSPRPRRRPPRRPGPGCPEAGPGGRNPRSSCACLGAALGPGRSGPARGRGRGCRPAGRGPSPAGRETGLPASPGWRGGRTTSRWAGSPAAQSPLPPAPARPQRGSARTSRAGSRPATPSDLPPRDSSGWAFCRRGDLGRK